MKRDATIEDVYECGRCDGIGIQVIDRREKVEHITCMSCVGFGRRLVHRPLKVEEAANLGIRRKNHDEQADRKGRPVWTPRQPEGAEDD